MRTKLPKGEPKIASQEILKSGVNSRIKTAATLWGIDTLAELQAAHEQGRTKQWKGIGAGSLAALDQFFAKQAKASVRATHKRVVAKEAERKKAPSRKAPKRNELGRQYPRFRKLDLTPERRTGPLHERLEFHAMQLATEAGRAYSPRLVLRALRCFELAEKVRDRRP